MSPFKRTKGMTMSQIYSKQNLRKEIFPDIMKTNDLPQSLLNCYFVEGTFLAF